MNDVGPSMEGRGVAVVHVPRKRGAERVDAQDFDPDIWDDIARTTPGRRSRTFKDRARIAVDRFLPEVVAAMALEPDRLDERFQVPFWKLVEHANGKPMQQIESVEVIMIRSDILDAAGPGGSAGEVRR